MFEYRMLFDLCKLLTRQNALLAKRNKLLRKEIFKLRVEKRTLSEIAHMLHGKVSNTRGRNQITRTFVAKGGPQTIKLN